MPQKIGETYRRPRRRPAYLRVKTGCLTCRQRKKKCDETRDTCQNCSRQGLSCVWQDSEGRPPSRPHPFVSTSSSSSVLLGSLESPRAYSSAITPASSPLFRFLTVTFLPQLIRPATDSRVIDDLSRESLALAFSNPFCMHALLACCGAEMPTQRPDFRQLGQFHYTRAVAGLRERLDKGLSGNQWVVSLLTIMMLCIYERSKPLPSSGVDIHLVGAARIIQLYSCLPQAGSEHPEMEQAMHRLLRESFIFHVATSLPFQGEQSHRNEIEIAFSLAEQALGQHFRPRLIVFPDSPVLGFPPQLFRCIYTIYRVYQDSSHEIPDGETYRKLDRDLHRWYDQIEASSGESSCEENAPGRDDVNVQGICQYQTAPNHLQAAVIGPKLYILGCRILLRRIPGFEAPGTASVLDSLICEGVDIVQRLQPDEDYFADYYCWPLLLIGIHSTDPLHRDVLLRQVLAFWRSTNNGTMRRLANMLDLHWKSHGDSRTTWDGPVP